MWCQNPGITDRVQCVRCSCITLNICFHILGGCVCNNLQRRWDLYQIKKSVNTEITYLVFSLILLTLKWQISLFLPVTSAATRSDHAVDISVESYVVWWVCVLHLVYIIFQFSDVNRTVCIQWVLSLSLRPGHGTQVLLDLWLQAELWPPSLPGALSPWKLWTLLAVQWGPQSSIYILYMSHTSTIYFQFFVYCIYNCCIISLSRFWWVDMPLWAHCLVPPNSLWYKTTRMQEYLYSKTWVWPSRWGKNLYHWSIVSAHFNTHLSIHKCFTTATVKRSVHRVHTSLRNGVWAITR